MLSVTLYDITYIETIFALPNWPSNVMVENDSLPVYSQTFTVIALCDENSSYRYFSETISNSDLELTNVFSSFEGSPNIFKPKNPNASF